MTPLRHGRNIPAPLPRLGTPRLKATAAAAVCSTHKRRRKPAPAACASAVHCGQKWRQAMTCFLCYFLFPPPAAGSANLSDLPASQTGYKSIPAQLQCLADIVLESRGDFSVLTFFLLTFQSTTFLWREKESPFFSQRTRAPALAETRLRNAARAPEEPVPQVFALHHRTLSI